MAASALHVFLDNDCSVRVYQSFVAVFQKNVSYHAGIMLNTFSDLLMFKIMLA